MLGKTLLHLDEVARVLDPALTSTIACAATAST
jgi:hypothetical protein